MPLLAHVFTFQALDEKREIKNQPSNTYFQASANQANM